LGKFIVIWPLEIKAVGRSGPEVIQGIQKQAVDIIRSFRAHAVAPVVIEPEAGAYPHGPLAVGKNAGDTWLGKTVTNVHVLAEITLCPYRRGCQENAESKYF
jgi:hypothetical protein